ncbi:unnamed protein product [Microthlaspi erraticum]|uniref:Uncharacterized protein n=1 Tax=Microthlaspi erraticum TaxID=1685480 RepID=A0A6D2JLP7_9BRAS|nr:unnamed protein product [Microthlaspi erraticum]
MEERKLNLDAPFLSVRRTSTTPDISSESDNTKKNTNRKTRRRKVKDSCQEKEHDQSFDHVVEPSLVPFLWEQTPGKPKTHHHHMAAKLTEESDLIKALEMVSSTASFSANCSTNGVTDDEFEKNEDIASNVSEDDVILENRDLIMSRFLPAAKAMAMKQKKESTLDQEEKMLKKKKIQSITLQRVSMAINQNLKNNDYDYDHNHVGETVDSTDSKKAMIGFLPRLCSKNTMDVLNPVLSRVKTCQNVGVKSASPRILRSNKIMSKSQESYPTPRFSTEISKTSLSISKTSQVVRIPRNTSRLQRTASSDEIQRQDTRFLVEEVKRRSKRNKIRSENLSVSQPPLPKTPSESWLCRTLPRSSADATVVTSGQVAGFKKMEKKTHSQSVKWETIVKKSYNHDHVRYSEELIVHLSCQQKS